MLEPRPPHEVVAELNNRFPIAELDGRYFTMLYAVVESTPNSLRMRYVVAGHPAPLLVPSNAADAIRTIEGTDFAVGWFAISVYEEQTLELHPGDRLFFFSDGITETMDERAQLFGEARLAEVLAANRGGSLHDQIKAVVHAADAFRHAEVLDDLSQLAVADPLRQPGSTEQDSAKFGKFPPPPGDAACPNSAGGRQ